MYRHHQCSTLLDFLQEVSEKTGLKVRKIKSWYYQERLPSINNKDLSLFCSKFNIDYIDFLTKEISIDDIKDYVPLVIDLSEKITINIQKIFIDKDINSPARFEYVYGGEFAHTYYYLLRRSGSHEKGVSWNFVLMTMIRLNVALEKIFR